MTGKSLSVLEAAAATTGPEASERRFAAFYEQHFDFVWRSVRMMGVTPDAADDAVQDVFLVAHRRLAEFDARGSERTWLFAIARRVVSARRRGARRWFRLLTQVSRVERTADPTPYETAARAESQGALLSALENLPEEQRIVFTLTELEEMSAPEIAAALGVNVNTVYSRLRLARRALAARLRAAEVGVTP